MKKILCLMSAFIFSTTIHASTETLTIHQDIALEPSWGIAGNITVLDHVDTSNPGVLVKHYASRDNHCFFKLRNLDGLISTVEKGTVFKVKKFSFGNSLIYGGFAQAILEKKDINGSIVEGEIYCNTGYSLKETYTILYKKNVNKILGDLATLK